ncbi:hypothetical protein [Saccharopolyspora karakumensis]|uniref:hypothetical protein n=1 Tax=Saccharopolyspora karakumensis TaxID=2530386 RepID=UPI001404AA77|nr:hypothetical protein [Saccharopolyspora karakumensis]
MPADSELDPTALDRLRHLLPSRRGVLWLRRITAAVLLLLALALALGQHSVVDIATAAT